MGLVKIVSQGLDFIIIEFPADHHPFFLSPGDSSFGVLFIIEAFDFVIEVVPLSFGSMVGILGFLLKSVLEVGQVMLVLTLLFAELVSHLHYFFEQLMVPDRTM